MRSLYRVLLRLYPKAWRERYGAEMEALIEATPAKPLPVIDLARGCVSEWSRTAFSSSQHRFLIRPAIAALAVRPLSNALRSIADPPGLEGWGVYIGLVFGCSILLLAVRAMLVANAKPEYRLRISGREETVLTLAMLTLGVVADWNHVGSFMSVPGSSPFEHGLYVVLRVVWIPLMTFNALASIQSTSSALRRRIAVNVPRYPLGLN